MIRSGPRTIRHSRDLITPFMMIEIIVSILCLGTSLFLWAKFKGLEHILINYRWIFVVFFLLPISLLYDIVFYIRNWMIFRFNSAPSKHFEKVAYVQQQVIEWKKSGQTVPMCTARPGWMAMSLRNARYKSLYANIKINLMDILEVDTEKKVVRVEPLVSMGQITATLSPLGWTLPVVPELDDLTISGLIMGVGIETSSHKYGLMQHVLVSAEVVVSDGSLVKCSKEENSDLFYALPWSHGTLGFLVAAELKIIPAKKYVKLSYIPLHSLEEIVDVFARQVESQDNDFVEGLMYSENQCVVMVGHMTNEAEPEKVNAIGNYYKPWFYKHVEEILESGPRVEYIPLRHYYHRHTKGIFWQMQDIIPFGNNIIFRYLLGWMMPPKVSLLKLTHNQTIKDMYEKYQIIQDMLLPMENLKEALQFFHKQLQLYPLWLCPFLLPSNPGFLQSHGKEGKYFVDIGAYGTPKVTNYDSYKAHRKLENFVLNLNGFQMLYADSYLSKEEFYKMFNHSLYEEMRIKYNAKCAFPEVYEKVNKKARI